MKFVPHTNQLEAMEHVYEVPRGALWMPMGGGKTVTTLTAMNNLSLVEDIFPALVLGPKRVVATTWPDEVEKWDHLSNLDVVPLLGEKRLREALLGRTAAIHAINYDNLQWLVEAWGPNWPYYTIIADEVTQLKGFRLRQGSKRAAALGKVAHTKTRRFLGLTGLVFPLTLATGGGHGLKVALLVFGMSVFLVTQVARIVDEIPRAELDLLRVLGASRARTMWEVVVRGTLDKTLDAVRQNVAMGWSMITMVEGISRAEGGLGAMLLNQNKHFRLAEVYAILAVVLVVGLLIDLGMGALEAALCPHARLVRNDS